MINIVLYSCSGLQATCCLLTVVLQLVVVRVRPIINSMHIDQVLSVDDRRAHWRCRGQASEAQWPAVPLPVTRWAGLITKKKICMQFLHAMMHE
jgi:hypothetical protein